MPSDPGVELVTTPTGQQWLVIRGGGGEVVLSPAELARLLRQLGVLWLQLTPELWEQGAPPPRRTTDGENTSNTTQVKRPTD